MRSSDAGELSKCLPYAVLTGLSIFAGIAVAIHFLQPDFHPATATLSMYVLGRFGWLVSAGFSILAVSLLLLSAGLYRHFQRSRLSGLPHILFFVVTAGVFLVAIFPTDLPGQNWSVAGTLHQAGAYLIFYLFPFMAYGFARNFENSPLWQAIYLPAFLIFVGYTGLLIAALTLLEIFGVNIHLGVIQRILIGFILAWMYLITGRLLHIIS